MCHRKTGIGNIDDSTYSVSPLVLQSYRDGQQLARGNASFVG